MYAFEEIATQSIGLCAFAIALYAFYQKNDDNLRIYMGLYAIVLAVHFYFLGALFGALGCLIAAARMFISLWSKGVYFLPLFICFYIYLFFQVDNSWIEYLPIIAGIIGTVCTFLMTGIMLRYGYLGGQGLWLSYNLYHFSVGGIMIEFFNMFVNITTIYRLYREKKKHD